MKYLSKNKISLGSLTNNINFKMEKSLSTKVSSVIIYSKFFDNNGENVIIGGIETYILNLGLLLVRLEHSVSIFQPASKNFIKEYMGISIVGYNTSGMKYNKIKKILYSEAKKFLGNNRGLLIFGADHVSVKTKDSNCVSIQHGISWDLPSYYTTKIKFASTGIGATLKKMQMNVQAYKDFNNCKNTVCVDYNFINWYRTIYPEKEFDKSVWIIPNFAFQVPSEDLIDQKWNSEKNYCKIIFARRFVEFRGVKIFKEAILNILKKYPYVHVTFAGEGPEETDLKSTFYDNSNVDFIKYSSNQSVEVHMNYDIAVIPSIASEGTSLSLLEAMAAGCLTIATNVGGMTNILIDGFNGYLIQPDSLCIENALEKVINLPLYKKRDIAKNAYSICNKAFNKEKWEDSWTKVINLILKKLE